MELMPHSSLKFKDPVSVFLIVDLFTYMCVYVCVWVDGGGETGTPLNFPDLWQLNLQICDLQTNKKNLRHHCPPFSSEAHFKGTVS